MGFDHEIRERIKAIFAPYIDRLAIKMDKIVSEDGNLEEDFFTEIQTLLRDNDLTRNILLNLSDENKFEIMNIAFEMINDYKYEQSKTNLAKALGFTIYADRIESITSQHVRTLATKWNQTVYQDDYGNFQFDKWFRELDYFVDNVLRKNKLVDDCLSDYRNISPTREFVMNTVRHYQQSRVRNNEIVDVDSLDPVQFEHYCANELRNNGWNVRVTPASGDQGIDVIATIGNIKAVFQCKKYSQPVGNGAVQEIIAGKQFENADIAAVVTNAAFTSSAKQLASTAGVFLLHYSELDGLAEKLGFF